MARVVGHYQSHVIGGATIYYYEKPDDTSKATRIHKGTEIRLPADYASSITNGMYRIIRPGSGWMFWWNVGDKTPVYEIVADKCKAPSVSLDLTSSMLVFIGGEGGELNTFEGYGVSWRDRGENTSEWGSWTEDIVTSEESLHVSRPEKGYVRQFRARTLGSAGRKYYSDYVICQTVLTDNSTALPAILFPQNGSVCRGVPWLIVYMLPDPDGETQQLWKKIDDGEWEFETECDPGVITESHKDIEGLDPGEHIVYVKMVDASGGESAVVSSTFTTEAFEWGREIQTGSVISNKKISHRKDIEELLETTNVLRKYCGLPAIEVLPGVVGRFSDWKAQMEVIRDALSECSYVFSESDWPKAIVVPEYPTAYTFNTLREAALDYY